MFTYPRGGRLHQVLLLAAEHAQLHGRTEFVFNNVRIIVEKDSNLAAIWCEFRTGARANSTIGPCVGSPQGRELPLALQQRVRRPELFLVDHILEVLLQR